MEYSYKTVKNNIEENEFQIKKKFGQNFIIDNNIDIPEVEKIKDDICIALTINDSDVTVKERNKIVKHNFNSNNFSKKTKQKFK